MTIINPALLAYIAQRDPLYHGKLIELREQITGWLNYIPQTFPNYTRHTIDHSDKIILQLSKLLFHEDDVRQPVLNLSAIEAYILCASAMLHDSGMVASDDEKERILQSVEWADWDSDALNVELDELKGLDFDLSLTGFDVGQ